MNLNELLNLKSFFKMNNSLKKFNSCVSTKDKEYVYLSNAEILEKINSGDFKKHPIYPVIVKYNGKEIYDLRDNFKVEIKKNKQGSKICRVLGYNRLMVSRLTAESWYNKIIKDDEDVHHIDFNEHNNFFKNLSIIKKKEHIEIHREIHKSKNKRRRRR